jgi:uncharacterized membrane protein YdjX (TVP38/TMEM64 family)
MNKASLIRFAVLLLVVAGLLVAVKFLPVQQKLEDFLQWVQNLGPWGPVALAAVYVVATVLMVPGSLLTLGAGFCFQLVVGFITVSIGSTLGATAAFLVGRTLARGLVEAKVAGNPKFRALDQAVGDQGFKIVLLTRLSPVFPFNLLNYAFGLTRVRLRDYVLASWIGMIPGTVMYVYFGTLAKELADLGTDSAPQRIGRLIAYAAGLIIAVAVTVFITRLARAALAKAVPSDPAEPVSRR